MTTTAAPIVYCLSIRQPWAHAILSLGKDVENRSKLLGDFNGRLVIHSPKTIDLEGLDYLKGEGIRVPSWLPTSCYVGSVEVYGHVPAYKAISPWSSDQGICYLLKDPYTFPEVVVGPGQLGIYRPSSFIARRLLELDPLLAMAMMGS